jgi:hypothetical protein
MTAKEQRLYNENTSIVMLPRLFVSGRGERLPSWLRARADLHLGSKM